MYNKDIVQGHWKEIKGKIRQQWGKFTDDDVKQLTGTFQELEGALQKKYGYQKEQADKEIKMFLEKNNWND